MKNIIVGSAVALALSSTTLSASPIQPTPDAGIAPVGTAQVWLAKGNNGNGKGNGHDKVKKPGKGNGNGKAAKDNGKPGKAKDRADKGKPDKAGGAEPKAKAKKNDRASNGKGDGADRRVFSPAEREDITRRIVSTEAPAGRDMARVLAATGLALAAPGLVVADTPEDELITYRNCPPGLAKKDPPCVPPGLAKKGVTYDEWAAYDADEYGEIWRERREDWLDRDFDVDPDPEVLLLQSDQIADLFDLDPAPGGQRYALIDGMPVLLDEEDYASLALLNQIAQARDLADGVRIAPTAALTQEELINLYRLPQLAPDQNYAVVNGQLVQMRDSEYELLQLIRIARAVL